MVFTKSINSFIFLLVSIVSISVQAQETSSEKSARNRKIGIGYGWHTQQSFPGTSNDYIYETKSAHIFYEWQQWQSGKWTFHTSIETALYQVDHQLLNFYFITPDQEDFQERRDRFTQARSFNEYVAHAGLKTVYNWNFEIKPFIQIRIGPMYGTQTTERLKRGFSFSDVLSIGTQYQVDEHEFIITYSLRHTSNAGLKFPNSGHNSSGFQISYAYLF